MSVWGAIQARRTLAPGIEEVATATHGGIILAEERHAEMPEPLRAIAPWAGPLAYEEDQDWAIVCLAWPDLFPPAVCAAALRTAKNARLWELDLPAFLETEPGRAVRARAALSEEART